MLEVLQCLLSGYLVVTSFCRLRKTDKDVVPAIRHAFALLATINVVLCLEAVCVLLVDEVPSSLRAHPATVLALIGIVVVQFVTARFWAKGVPDRFKVYRQPPLRRASDAPKESCVQTPS